MLKDQKVRFFCGPHIGRRIITNMNTTSSYDADNHWVNTFSFRSCFLNPGKGNYADVSEKYAVILWRESCQVVEI